MKLGKNSRKKLKAVRRALMLGLPVAGLLATAGCEREKSPQMTQMMLSGEEPSGLLGRVQSAPRGGDDRLGGGIQRCRQMISKSDRRKS